MFVVLQILKSRDDARDEESPVPDEEEEVEEEEGGTMPEKKVFHYCVLIFDYT